MQVRSPDSQYNTQGDNSVQDIEDQTLQQAILVAPSELTTEALMTKEATGQIARIDADPDLLVATKEVNIAQLLSQTPDGLTEGVSPAAGHNPIMPLAPTPEILDLLKASETISYPELTSPFDRQQLSIRHEAHSPAYQAKISASIPENEPPSDDVISLDQQSFVKPDKTGGNGGGKDGGGNGGGGNGGGKGGGNGGSKNDPNEAPVVSGPVTASVAEDSSVTVTATQLLSNATDADGNTLNVENLQVIGSNASVVDNGDGTWTITPAADFNGDLSLSYDVSDGTVSVPAALDVSVTPVNDDPFVSGPVAASVAEDSSITVTAVELLANATDIDGDALSIDNLQVEGGNATVVDNGDGTWTVTPAADFNGDLSLNYDVSDGTVSVPASLDVSFTPVNDVPVVSGSIATSVSEDSSLTITSAALLANATDIDGDVLNVSNLQVVGGNSTVVDNGDGTWTITPAANFNGDLSLSYDVDDGTVSVPAALDVTVTPVNDAPVISGPITASVAEDSSLTITSAALLANASDIDGDVLNISNLQVVGGNGTVVDNGDGTWTITPAADFNGDLSLSYDVDDGTVDVPASLEVSVTPVNDGPVVSGPVTASVAEGTSVTITSAALLANATDVDGDTLIVSNLQVVGSNATVVDNEDGTWTITPVADFNGELSLNYDVSDGTEDVPAILEVSVTSVNDGPVVSGPVTASVAEDSSITITAAALLANASDSDGDVLSVSNLLVVGGNATVVDNGNGTWTITPAADFNGDLSLSYDVSDGTATVPASLDVSVTAVNDGPVVSGPVAASVAEDASVTVTAAELLANATDVDGDALSVSNLKVDGGNATVVANGDGTWTITPAANFNGDLSLSYDVSDGTKSGNFSF